MKSNFSLSIGIVLVSFVFLSFKNDETKLETPQKPNIIYIMLDEVGYFEPSYMGNKNLLTPNIDKMAKEGMHFTNAYAGASVCAPTRVSLMTGKHMGHTSMRSNGGGAPIRLEEETVASILKKAGYATGGFGKWGCGNRGTSGVPEKHGFDQFYGYYDQVHAHSFYPEYLINNSKEIPLKGNVGKFYIGETHAQDEIFKEAVKFIKSNSENPFFCYLPFTPPHGLWGFSKDHPSYKLFADKDWNVGQYKLDDGIRYAAMLHMTDGQIGEIFKLLEDLEIDDNTIVFFSGDNGGADYFPSKENPRGLFGANVNPETGVEFRGRKGNVYEGGLKIPMVVRWPGKIKENTKNDLVWYFPDFMATASELAGVDVPEYCDGLSILPTLLGKKKQHKHDYLFWIAKNTHALRSGDWKAYATTLKNGEISWELYNLKRDPGETNNVALSKKRILSKLEIYMKEAYTKPIGGEIYDKDLFRKDHIINGSKPPRFRGN
ncbi:MAG: arylsulfatase [Candidatus Theseobacter exili]|nr:arylsulfatase [Candidatus Theseobacter exili]